MSFNTIIIYILSFAGLFTSIFYFLTLTSPRKSKAQTKIKYFPKISVIIPIWNEGSANGERLRKTLDSLLNCDYPKDKLEIIIVNDGSTDNSLELAKEYEKHGAIVLSHKVSQGKTNAVNKGMKYATGELVTGFDADSFMMPDVFMKLIPCFNNKNVMAAIPSIKIWKPKSILQMIQAQEFFSAVFIRYLQSELGGLPLAPGAFTLIRKSFLDKYGQLSSNTMVEDLEISLRIQSENYLIEHIIDANVYTSGVKTFKAFVSQRLRWFCGFIIQIKKYKHLINKKYGNLGVFILPSSIGFVLLSLIAFSYGIVMIVYNLIKYLIRVSLVGINLDKLFELKLELFFMDINNQTMIPILLLIILFSYIMYTKVMSKEKQPIFWQFVVFTLTYWFLGPFCWIKAIYYHLLKKKIKWGPNYFTS
jgi:cellulose synthase/poly-beta-1,6-N-acetylglucosamine synthase-like glycosyltransferase